MRGGGGRGAVCRPTNWWTRWPFSERLQKRPFTSRERGRSCLRPCRITQSPAMAVFSRKRVHRPPEEVESSQTVLRATQWPAERWKRKAWASFTLRRWPYPSHEGAVMHADGYAPAPPPAQNHAAGSYSVQGGLLSGHPSRGRESRAREALPGGRGK